MGTETYHVVPLEDWVLHEEQRDLCACGPHVEYFPAGRIVVHHALDGRYAGDPWWARRRAAQAASEHLGELA